MKRFSYIILAAFVLALTGVAHAGNAKGTLNVTATIVTSGGKCTFQNINGLNFPALNPTNPVDVTASANVTIHCTKVPTTFDLSADGGLHYSSGNRLQNTADALKFIRYNVTGTSDTIDVKKNPDTVSITGTILGSDYGTAYVGNYSDTVILTLTY